MQDQEGTRINGWIQSNVRFGPVSDIRICKQDGRYSVEVQVQSLFKPQVVGTLFLVDRQWIDIETQVLMNARKNSPTMLYMGQYVMKKDSVDVLQWS